MSKPSIMVLANEEVISALLGAMVELDGYAPVFPAADEQPLSAVRRHRPDLLLLDCENDLAWDPVAMRAITTMGSRILLFSAMRSQREIEQVAARYNVAAFVLPVAYRDFTTQIDQALGKHQSNARAMGA